VQEEPSIWDVVVIQYVTVMQNWATSDIVTDISLRMCQICKTEVKEHEGRLSINWLIAQEMDRIDMDKIAVKDILAAEKNYTEGPKERRYFFFALHCHCQGDQY
jgi:hypothetical protein